MRIAFYAPLKPPDHPVPSGDRQIAQLFLAAMRLAGHEPILASRFRSYEGSGDPVRQARLAALNAHPLVGEARGIGLIGGVELVADKKTKRAFAPGHAVAARAVAFAEAEGLIVRSVLGDGITLSPPLIISAAEVDALFDRLTRALDKTLDWVTREHLAQS